MVMARMAGSGYFGSSVSSFGSGLRFVLGHQHHKQDNCPSIAGYWWITDLVFN
jgi:hypothetical protein